MKDFQQIEWDEVLADDCRQLVRLAIREDLDRGQDWTTLALVGDDVEGSAQIVARSAGVVAGLRATEIVIEQMEPRLVLATHVADGAAVDGGTVLADLRGPARAMLTAERPLLNFLGHLSGVASLAQQFVRAVEGTKARIYDTRKTLPGWRRLEKYAVRCGGGCNHRTGLFDAILIKDNHLAMGAASGTSARFTPAVAVQQARAFLATLPAHVASPQTIVEVEVDSVEQFKEVLPAGPDIVLLDNMTPDVLAQCARWRDEHAPAVQLEASGGVTLETVRSIAASGVDRISVGALTHSAAWFDVGLDWSVEAE